jgi:hypothetical protein
MMCVVCSKREQTKTTSNSGSFSSPKTETNVKTSARERDELRFLETERSDVRDHLTRKDETGERMLERRE